MYGNASTLRIVSLQQLDGKTTWQEGKTNESVRGISPAATSANKYSINPWA